MIQPTPVTMPGLHMYDTLPPEEAVIAAWVNTGPNPQWHRRCQDVVRQQMPLLARALDRLAEENDG